MHRTSRALGSAGALLLLLASAAGAQTAVKISGPKKLRAQAKVAGDSAAAIARREVPNARIKSAELEREGGKLIYSFDMKVPGKSGVEEVHVDATTGAVLAHEHETPAMERTEAAADAKAKAEKKAKKAAKSKTP